VDTLEEEGLPGIQGFGTLLVVPAGDGRSTSFQFALPPTVLASEPGSNERVFHLLVHKQPGTVAHPLTVRLHLPAHATLISNSVGGILQNDHFLLDTDLRTDLELEVVFAVP
jgi:hypothetical protein